VFDVTPFSPSARFDARMPGTAKALFFPDGKDANLFGRKFGIESPAATGV